jgi:FixJ family two-component response regulator
LPDGRWQDILSSVTDADNPPCLIVSSNLADERLWAEVLNEGGYDLLPKPFESKEVTRVISLAWLHWKNQLERTLKRMRAG